MNQTFSLDLEDFQIAVHDALASWGEIGSSAQEQLPFLLLIQEERHKMGDNLSPIDYRRATNQVLLNAIGDLKEQDEMKATVLEARFIEGEITRQVASRMHVSPDQVNRLQRAAIEDLTHILLSQEMVLRHERQQELEAFLPPRPYGRLFGLEVVQEEVVEQLLKPDGSWCLVIGGIGGIGKTSLADAAVRQITHSLTFRQVIWQRVSGSILSGKNLPPEKSYEQLLNGLAEMLWPDSAGEDTVEQRQRLRQALRTQPYLVVVDNLETEEETTYLLHQIQELVTPSKFLLTSRAGLTLPDLAYYLSLEELSFPDAAALVKHHASTIGLEELIQTGEDDVEAIYALTGGNPLALKLVVSLAAVLPMPQILADLAKSRPGPIEDLYRNIYWRAWKSLTKESQALLQAMPLVSESGALPEQMKAISKLKDDQFWLALTDLVSRSLLEVRGTIHERRYGIHRLTETFLRTEIIHWPE
jgi:hypothetical protein